MIVFPKAAPPGQKNALARLRRLLADKGAAKVGETAVVSLKIHIQDVSSPAEVTAITTVDAGQVFYGRDRHGEVLHIDVFHSPGCLDPKVIGRRLLAALSGMRFEPASGGPPPGLDPLLSYIDIQTGAGGGRLDGELTYGTEEGVRRAHMTHVHIACLAVPEMVASVFTAIAAVESAIEEMGLELRRIERVRLAKGNGPLDMSNYRASSDSLLRQLTASGQDTAASAYRKEALARKAAQDIGSAADSEKLLEQLSHGLRAGEFAKLRLDTDKGPDELRQIVTKSGLARYDGHRYTLTRDGMMALSYLKEHSAEVESYLRRLLWSLPAKRMPAGERRGQKVEPSLSRGRGMALPAAKGESLPELAIPETAISWALRARGSTLAAVPKAGTGNAGGFGNLTVSDLRFSYARERRGAPIILLLDASASMAGRRIRAAKELARHLVLAGKEKVSIVAFQDSDVKVVSDFTRNRRKVEQGLREVQALGLTPLASGLEKALELSLRSAKKPLVLVITDGIPTVPSKSMSPVDDALEAAKKLAKRGVRLGCVGLEPNRGFLRQMVTNARGALYIVDELEASTLAAIAKRESAYF